MASFMQSRIKRETLFALALSIRFLVKRKQQVIPLLKNIVSPKQQIPMVLIKQIGKKQKNRQKKQKKHYLLERIKKYPIRNLPQQQQLILPTNNRAGLMLMALLRLIIKPGIEVQLLTRNTVFSTMEMCFTQKVMEQVQLMIVAVPLKGIGLMCVSTQGMSKRPWIGGRKK